MIQIVIPDNLSGGVYDFAVRLQNSLGLETRLIRLSSNNVCHWNVAENDTVILQMSGYGFERRGAPLWLLRALKNRRKIIKNFGVFFHELYAFGPPWTSSFWLSPLQRYIARQLAEISDFWMISREGSAEWLCRYAGNKPHAVLPVFSTIGEPSSLAEIRQPRIIVFGSEGLRQKTYLEGGEKLFDWAKQAGLVIHDVGAPIRDERLSAIFCAQSVVQHGRLDDQSVRHLMHGAQFGLLAYAVDYAAKSSVFAAYCAHGMCPVLLSNGYEEADGLIAGSQYLPGIPAQLITTHQANVIGRTAWEWYQPHQLSRHAETLLAFVHDCEGH